MAQFASHGGPRSSASILTVADILSRNAPVPVKILGSQTTPPLSVGSLLRREGRAPDGVERSRAARTGVTDGATTVVASATAEAAPRLVVRRGALAAGALLAAGSVFGLTVLNDTAAVSDPTPSSGPYAGQGILDNTATTPAAPGVVITPTAATSGLDAGMSAPSAWAPVAFPQTLRDANTAAGGERPAPAASTRTPQAPAAGGNDAGKSPTGTTGGGSTSNPGAGTPGSTGGGGSSTPGGTADNGTVGGTVVGGTVKGATGAVGGLVSGVGNALPSTPGGTVDGLGQVVTSTGAGLGSAVDTVLAPTASLLGGLL